MEKNEAYHVVGKHIYTAFRMYTGSHQIIILADNKEEARQKAVSFLGVSTVVVRRITQTKDPQIYEI